MTTTVTQVEISLFKPQGFSDRWFVATENRGKAVRAVLAQYGERQLHYLNMVSARLSSRDQSERERYREVVL